jgi:class 3 adenylate cyclase
LARLYSTFVHAMIRCAWQGGGHVRNIIGDRVMIVFDADGCFRRAAHTATLCNTAAHRIISTWSTRFDFRCGVGIDYGPMVVMKAGVPRRGGETEFYRSLVWLGRPANVASKLTDLAHKMRPAGEAGRYPPVLITSEVLDGLEVELDMEHPAYEGWSPEPLTVPGYGGLTYGANPLISLAL